MRGETKPLIEKKTGITASSTANSIYYTICVNKEDYIHIHLTILDEPNFFILTSKK